MMQKRRNLNIMVTIKTEIKTSGNSLMKNKLCEFVIKPSQSGKIRFFSPKSQDHHGTYNIFEIQQPEKLTRKSYLEISGKLEQIRE